MIIVVDTNVFISACLGNGAPVDVLQLCFQGVHQPLMGAALLAEHEDVLGRDKLFKKSRLNNSERSELLDIYLACCRWTRIYYGWRPNLPDEGDNHLMELAVAGNSKAIVTKNLRHLRSTELKFPDIDVITPGQLLKLEKNL